MNYELKKLLVYYDNNQYFVKHTFSEQVCFNIVNIGLTNLNELNCENKVCLTSIGTKKIISSLYALLQKTYPNQDSFFVKNPIAQFDFTEEDCLITIEQNEFLLEFKDIINKKMI